MKLYPPNDDILANVFQLLQKLIQIFPRYTLILLKWPGVGTFSDVSKFYWHSLILDFITESEY